MLRIDNDVFLLKVEVHVNSYRCPLLKNKEPFVISVCSEQHTMLFGGSTQCRTKNEDGEWNKG